MATWSRFSGEVNRERTRINDYGVEIGIHGVKFKFLGFSGAQVNSYKSQALVELAMRLVLEEKAKELYHEHMKLIDRVEELELELDLAGAGKSIAKKRPKGVV